MLDEFRVSAPAGFPDHPHRGFETVTYMLTGATEHEDFTGRRGVINPGDLQWMTAGRGIVHCEMPVKNSGEGHGLQLWVNLSKKYKMVEPNYQELLDKDIPRTATSDGLVQVKIMYVFSLNKISIIDFCLYLVPVNQCQLNLLYTLVHQQCISILHLNQIHLYLLKLYHKDGMHLLIFLVVKVNLARKKLLLMHIMFLFYHKMVKVLIFVIQVIRLIVDLFLLLDNHLMNLLFNVVHL
jgi:hypothetical protein